MFVEAIQKVGEFTRPIHMISLVYGEKEARPGAGTMFFVNNEGVAVTCKHISSLIKDSGNILQQYQQFQQEKKSLNKSASYNKKMSELKQKYGYDKPDAACQVFFQFVDAADNIQTIDILEHPVYDLAIIKFHGFKNLGYRNHAVFAKDSASVQPGLFVCRLGYPFPEFTNFYYDEPTETINWNQTSVRTVRFPLEGMITRHIMGTEAVIAGIEVSTPGLRGQSGGPLFDAKGIVYGMQSMTMHLHLGFDMKNHEMISGGKKIRVTNQPCLHVGSCVHMDVIKNFLKENNIKYFESE